MWRWPAALHNFVCKTGRDPGHGGSDPKLKALIVLTQPPVQEGGAPGKCAIGLMRGLREHGVDAHAVAARRSFAHAGAVPDDLSVELVDADREVSRWRAAGSRLRQPLGALGQGAFSQRVKELSADVDIVHLEETETAAAGVGLQRPALVHMHYLTHLDRSLSLHSLRSEEGRFALECSWAERRLARSGLRLVASSPRVAQELHELSRRRDVVVAPLALDPGAYDVAPLSGPPVAGFLGTAAWPPTATALRRLVDRVWPLVLRRVPDARLRIAGRGTRSLLGPQPGPGVELLGEVDSAADFLQQLSVLAYPLERGSGIKVKVLEAIASGLPVVTTREGCEGIDAGEGAVIAEDDEALAAALVSILSDEEERRKRGLAAREAFERRHAPGPATAPLVALYERMLSEPRAATR